MPPSAGRSILPASPPPATRGDDAAPPPPPPHALPVDNLLAALQTHPTSGLTSAEAADRLARHGPNELPSAPPEPWRRRLARQFADLLIWVLIAAAVVSGLLGEWVDALAILAIVALNGLLGFVQEGRAGRALAALRRLSSPHARVIRDGRPLNILAAELVPGDRIDLEAGDRIPADVRLLSASALRIEEAVLTGESAPVDKDHRAVLDADTPLGDRANMAFMGTAVVAGTAGAVVVATGMRTEIGRIAGLLEQQDAEQTPLQKRLGRLARVLVYVVLAIVAVMFAVQVIRGEELVGAFLLSVSLAVAAVPEGLSAVVTVALALGLQRMARRSALIRRLPTVETLGAVTVICTDKTGTLTRNEMTVREVLTSDRRFRITGGGYEPRGEFLHADDHAAPVDPRREPDLLRALTIAAWCGHAQVTRPPTPPSPPSPLTAPTAPPTTGKWEVVGDPTEGALVVAALKAGLPIDRRQERIVREIPFSSDRKAMSVIARPEDDGPVFLFTKGAPEVVLGMCSRERREGRPRELTDARRREILEAAHDMAARALRVLALADREAPPEGEPDETDLVFAGLVGMMDPPRDEARQAVDRCLAAGIRPVMITGDHPDTAGAIARDLHILGADGRILVGGDLDRMSDEALAAEVDRFPVYARVTAAHKLKIVKAWRSRGEVVAMTGDGVNDAPAIKAADVGIAMGVAGADVTKESSDMVLTDDNFASIVNAVEQGRTIYNNIRKFVHYLLATNAGEVLLMFGAVLAGWPAPLVAIQILWINLVTDALPAMALGVEPPEPDVMRRPPRRPGEQIIGRRLGLHILLHGALNAAAAAAAFYAVYRGQEANIPAARTAAFATLAFSQLFFAVGCRSHTYTLPQLGLFSNPWLFTAIAASTILQMLAMTTPFFQRLFKVEPIDSAGTWLLIAALAAAPVTVVEVNKLIRAALGRSQIARSPAP